MKLIILIYLIPQTAKYWGSQFMQRKGQCDAPHRGLAGFVSGHNLNLTCCLCSV